MSKESDKNSNHDESTATNASASDSIFESLEGDSFRAASGSESPEQIVDLLEQQVSDLRERELKAQAELENFRKRLLRDTEQQLKYALLPFVRDIVEVVDNLNRATEAGASKGNTDGLIAGVKLVQQQFQQVLAKYSCAPIEALGKSFDPNFHQAIAQQPSAEYAAGMVMLETSVGYLMYDRVVRPSMVIVSTGPAS
ncbi:MAG: nucleotide exchange factor GrpE [Pirellula staleyi]